jgi:hypothetical protein
MNESLSIRDFARQIRREREKGNQILKAVIESSAGYYRLATLLQHSIADESRDHLISSS